MKFQIIFLTVTAIFYIAAIVNAGCPFAGSLAFGRQLYATIKQHKANLIGQTILITTGMPASNIWSAGPLTNETIRMYDRTMELLHAQQSYWETCAAAPGANNSSSALAALSEQVPLAERSQPAPKCAPDYPFRRPTGACNNARRPLQGASYTPFSRLLPAVYDDNFHAMRSGSDGMPLASPRLISNRVATIDPYVLAPQRHMNHMCIMFGQYITHDTAWRQTNQIASGEFAPRCCTSDYKRPLPVALQYNGCKPIAVPADDKFLAPLGIGCIDYIRSQPIVANDGSLGTVQISNSVTHQLDNSNIYGSTDEALRSVRPPPASDTGELLNTPAGDLLPQTVGCKPPGCYFTGDLRGAFYPTLTLLHTAMMRLHNRHARALRAVNAHWGAERVFQEARRLTTAVYQHVTYNEWARTVLGDRAVAVGNVSTAVAGADGQSAYSGWYDAEVDGSTMDDHTTGAARSMHQHTPERMRLYDENYALTDDIALDDSLKYGPELLETKFDSLARGLLNDGATYGPYSDVIRNPMFKDGNAKGVGTDLLSIDIQRGRDHGIPTFLAHFERCFPGRTLRTWLDLYSVFPYSTVETLKSLYASPADIDLVVGLMLESRTGDHLGATTRCMFAEQLRRWKTGDPHFYSLPNGVPSQTFAPAQLASIHRLRWADVLCMTTGLTVMPERAFESVSWQNPLRACANRTLDFKLWREKV